MVTLALGAIVFAAAIRTSAPGGSHLVYHNEEDGYEVTLPARWTLRRLTLQDGRRIDVFASPNVSSDQASCSVGSSDNEAWSGKFQDEINKEIAAGALDKTLEPLVGASGASSTLITSKHVVQNGMTAVVAEFSQDVAVDGQSAKMRTKLFVTGSPGRIRYIHCVAFEHKLREVDAQFDRLIASYRLI